jgi:MYXO-CTERM domain-containing protein
MRQPVLLASPFIAALLFASTAEAATWYVSPTGAATSGCDTRACPCSLTAAGNGAVAGDTVILMDGLYKQVLYVTNSGTADAWITFKADECATPIIEGQGVGPTDGDQTNGVHSTTATHLRFIGIVSRGWNTGFGNGWTGTDTTSSNGNWAFEYCAAYSNGRTGFTFFSATGVQMKNCISAHNGSSTVQSWSSGFTLLQAKGSTNLVEGNVSFENMDAQNNSDGSGFIVDEHSDGATFINNIAFRNGGSCLRLTRSAGTKFINNTCYHNALNPNPVGPYNPSEVYFTDAESKEGVTFNNNVFIATGTGGGENPIFGKPSVWGANNVEATGSVNHFTSPEGTNADFTLSSASTALIDKGGAGTPTNDVGFDPKCIVKREPILVGAIAKGSWWQYDVDIDYIKSIGGVQKCFNPATRDGASDIGAYKDGMVTTKAPGSCTAPAAAPVACPMGGAGGTGGMPGTGGTGTAGGSPSAGGSMAAGGVPGTGGGIAAGGAPTGAGGLSTGGSVSAAGGAPATGGSVGTAGSAVSTGGTTPTGSGGTTSAGAGGSAPMGTGGSGASAGTGGAGEEPGGCGCRVVGQPHGSKTLVALGVLGLGLSLLRRRRSRRRAS